MFIPRKKHPGHMQLFIVLLYTAILPGWGLHFLQFCPIFYSALHTFLHVGPLMTHLNNLLLFMFHIIHKQCTHAYLPQLTIMCVSVLLDNILNTIAPPMRLYDIYIKYPIIIPLCIHDCTYI